jgi:hypothetical protein
VSGQIACQSQTRRVLIHCRSALHTDALEICTFNFLLQSIIKTAALLCGAGIRLTERQQLALALRESERLAATIEYHDDVSDSCSSDAESEVISCGHFAPFPRFCMICA